MVRRYAANAAFRPLVRGAPQNPAILAGVIAAGSARDSRTRQATVLLWGRLAIDATRLRRLLWRVGMLRRAIGVVLAVTLSIPAVVIASGLSPFAAQPAQAEGFNFLCGGSGGGGGDSEFSTLATGLATKIISDQAFWFATITVPAGVPVTAPGAVTDPVTHATTFTMQIAPKLGNSQKLDFIPDSFPGGAGDEIRLGYAFRSKAGQRADDLSMKEMFTENFGVPLSGGDVNVAGVDIDMQTNAAIGNMQGFDATFAALYSYQLANGSTNFAAGRFNINSKRPGADPGRGDVEPGAGEAEWIDGVVTSRSDSAPSRPSTPARRTSRPSGSGSRSTG